jgi:hypothetical protein
MEDSLKVHENPTKSPIINQKFFLLCSLPSFAPDEHLPERDVFTFLSMSCEALPAKTWAMSLSYPGLDASKLASKTQIYLLQKRVSLGARSQHSFTV